MGEEITVRDKYPRISTVGKIEVRPVVGGKYAIELIEWDCPLDVLELVIEGSSPSINRGWFHWGSKYSVYLGGVYICRLGQWDKQLTLSEGRAALVSEEAALGFIKSVKRYHRTVKPREIPSTFSGIGKEADSFALEIEYRDREGNSTTYVLYCGRKKKGSRI